MCLAVFHERGGECFYVFSALLLRKREVPSDVGMLQACDVVTKSSSDLGIIQCDMFWAVFGVQTVSLEARGLMGRRRVRL